MLDAPVSGGPSGAAFAQDGDLGSAATKPHLTGISLRQRRRVYRAATIAPIGSATVAKLVHNMSSYVITCALAGYTGQINWAWTRRRRRKPRQGVGGRRLMFDGLLDQFLPGTYLVNFALKFGHQRGQARDRPGTRARRLARISPMLRRREESRCWKAANLRVVMLLEQEVEALNIAACTGAGEHVRNAPSGLMLARATSRHRGRILPVPDGLESC